MVGTDGGVRGGLASGTVLRVRKPRKNKKRCDGYGTSCQKQALVEVTLLGQAFFTLCAGCAPKLEQQWKESRGW